MSKGPFDHLPDAEFVRMMRIRYGYAAQPESSRAEIERLILIATSRFQDPPPPLPGYAHACPAPSSSTLTTEKVIVSPSSDPSNNS